jgi:hypothetical protein
VWKDAATNAGSRERLLASIEERHSGDTEQENGRGSNQSDKNKMEEHPHPDCRFRSSIRHCPIRIKSGQQHTLEAAVVSQSHS